jgi:ATP-binding cassette subfamily F protein 3
MMLDELNLLILDEPTNHLDAATREVLEDAILGYNGTVIAVSHDRYFIKKLATRILEIRHDGYFDYKGNYEDFCEYKKSKYAVKTEAVALPEEKEKSGKNDYLKGKQEKSRRRKAEKQLADAEKGIAQCEERLSQIDKEMEEAGSDYIKTAALYEEQDALHAKLDEFYELWDKASEELSEDL